jgi:hypothetical protein
MRFLTGLTFLANIGLWLFVAVLAFIELPELGWTIIIGFISFLIAWNLSGGIVTSVADYFFQPEWTVFKTKLKWANGVGVTSSVIALFIILALSEYS